MKRATLIGGYSHGEVLVIDDWTLPTRIIMPVKQQVCYVDMRPGRCIPTHITSEHYTLYDIGGVILGFYEHINGAEVRNLLINGVAAE